MNLAVAKIRAVSAQTRRSWSCQWVSAARARGRVPAFEAQALSPGPRAASTAAGVAFRRTGGGCCCSRRRSRSASSCSCGARRAARNLGRGGGRCRLGGLLEFGARVTFCHPLTRSAIYQAASPHERRQRRWRGDRSTAGSPIGVPPPNASTTWCAGPRSGLPLSPTEK